MRRWAAWTLPLLAAAQAHAGEVQPSPSAPDAAMLDEQDLLLFEVTLDRSTLTDSLQAYNVDGSLLLPVSELARLLDLNIEVRPREGQIIGRLGGAQRSLLVDLETRTARVDARSIDIGPNDAVAGLTEIYLSAKLIERLLPLRIAVDDEALLIALTATEQLPIQAKLERLARLRGVRPEVASREEVLWIESPPALLSMPAFDVALDASAEATEPTVRRRYDIRAGADALHTGFQGYLGSDERGRPATARLLFERRDLEGDLLGPVGATRLSFGDVYTPSLAVGARSIGGRGIAVSTAPLEQTSVFDRVDLRGELPLGYDVELYINDVLRGGQQTPVQGRYEFLDVPLVRGVNVIRIVSYGPRGERSEETRVINVAGGALPRGELAVEAGVVQQEKPLIDLRRDDGAILTPGSGDIRATAGIAYGLTEALTLVGGASLFTPAAGSGRFLGTLGVRTSVLGHAVQADAGYDDEGGKGISLGAAGTPLGVSTVLRHAEYRDGFIDEALPSGGDGRALERHTEATMDFSIGPVAGLTVPFSIRALRDEFEDGRTALLGGVRLSTSAGSILVSTGFDYSRATLPGQSAIERLTGNLSASTFAGNNWQLRGTADYDLLPSAKLRAVAFTVDRDLSDRLAIRLGAGRAFLEARDDSTLQAAAIVRLPFADMSLTGDYTAPRDDWRIGLQMAFGVVYDPFRQRYALSRPGSGVGGNAAVRAFIDRDADDRFDPAIDEPVANVRVGNGPNERSTDADGRVLVTGLGYGTTARLQLDLDGIDNPYVTSPPPTVEFMPRAGGVARILYPLKPVGELLARVQFRDARGRMTGLSAVRVRVVRDHAPPVEASTEFDGSVLFERLAAGRYRLELDPVQASRLGMILAAPIEFEVPADGGFIPDVVATVIFEERARAAPAP